MRILHVMDCAGVAENLAKYSRGVESRVMQFAHADPFRHNRERYNGLKTAFAMKAILAARDYDWIVVHYHNELLPWFRHLNLAKKIAMYYHGSDLRGRDRSGLWEHADLVFFATPDLVDSGVPGVHIPTPVDTELFAARPWRGTGEALHIAKGPPMHRSPAEMHARRLGLRFKVRDRLAEPAPYAKMPELLSEYSYYVDQTLAPALSKTALESLSLGLKVVRWDGKVVSGLPEEHRAENSARLFIKALGG